MISFFTSLHFLNPIALWTIGVIPLLVFAYLYRDTFKKTVVSSILILQTLSAKKTISRRFRPPLRFFFELAALLLLVLAASIPLLEAHDVRGAVILDNSLSMSAQSLATNSRLRNAAEKLRLEIPNYSAVTSWSLFVTSPTLKEVESNLSASDLISKAKDITPIMVTDRIEGALHELFERGEFSQIVIITDKEAEFLPDKSNEVGDDSKKLHTMVSAYNVSSELPNLYVNSFTVAETATQSISLVARISRSGLGSGSIKVDVFGGTFDSKSYKETLLSSRTVTIGPNDSAISTFELPAEKNIRVYHIKISQADVLATSGDSILSDNDAYASIDAAQTSKLALISPRVEANAYGLKAISGLAIEQLTPEQFSSLSPEQLSNYALLVFNQTSPTYAPNAPTLLLGPPQENPLFPVIGNITRPKVTSYSSAHPITSYLRLSLLEPPTAEVFAVPQWAQGIIGSEKGSLVIAGESRGIRYAGVGFALLPFEGAKTPLTSVLFLNLVDWLIGQQSLASALQVGSAIKLPSSGPYELYSPQGTVQTINDNANTIYFEQPGIYSLKHSATNEISYYPINVFTPEESETAVTKTFSVNKVTVTEKKVTQNTENLWQALLWVAFAILVFDLILRFFVRDKELWS